MAFKPKSYTASDLGAPKGGSGNGNGNNSETDYPESVRLNTVLSIGKTAKVGTAKEVVVALVGMFRARTPNGNIHALKCIDPDDGTEGVLFLNTQLVTFDDRGAMKHFVAGTFYGNCLTTFGRRVSESVDEGYDGDFDQCDGEWVLNEKFYGQVIHLGKKAIPPKNAGGRVYQVLDWRCEREKEYPHLAEFLAEYEDRENTRASAAEEAAPVPEKTAPVKGKHANNGTSQKKSGQSEKAKPDKSKPKAKAKDTGIPTAEKFVQTGVEKGIDPADIAVELQIIYSMSETEAADLIDAIANADTEIEEDPIVTRALELFNAGSTLAAVSKKIGVEFVGTPSADRLTAIKEAHALFAQ